MRASCAGRAVGGRLGDLGCPDRLAGPDGAAGRPGARGRGLSLGDVGRRAQPPLLARRLRLPRVGVHAALPAPRPCGDARRDRAARRWRGPGAARASRAATRPGACSQFTWRSCSAGFAGVHGRRGDGRAVSLGGAAAEASRCESSCASASRPSRRSTALRVASRWSVSCSSAPGSRSGSPELRAGRSRPDHGRHASPSGRCTPWRCCCAARSGSAAAGLRCCTWRGFALVAVVLPLTHFAA